MYMYSTAASWKSDPATYTYSRKTVQELQELHQTMQSGQNLHVLKNSIICAKHLTMINPNFKIIVQVGISLGILPLCLLHCECGNADKELSVLNNMLAMNNPVPLIQLLPKRAVCLLYSMYKMLLRTSSFRPDRMVGAFIRFFPNWGRGLRPVNLECSNLT